MNALSDEPAPDSVPDAEWDAGNMGCGELVMGLRMRLQTMKAGQILKLTATDGGMPEDLPAWCRLTGHKLVLSKHPEYWIQRREN
ncbi:MAG: sulfurtransferase TusA family protein [Acidobacteria bacterium]|nr:sulfurtransferase TusA family protein [Acidobacteriota bacterium]